MIKQKSPTSFFNFFIKESPNRLENMKEILLLKTTHDSGLKNFKNEERDENLTTLKKSQGENRSTGGGFVVSLLNLSSGLLPCWSSPLSLSYFTPRSVVLCG